MGSLELILPKTKQLPPICNPDLPSMYHMCAIYGRMGAGKSILTANLILKELPYLKKVFWFSPTIKGDRGVMEILKTGDFSKITFLSDFDIGNLYDIIKNEIKDDVSNWKNDYELAERIKALRDAYKKRYKRNISNEKLLDKLDELEWLNKDASITLDVFECNFEDINERRPNFAMIIDDNLDSPLLNDRVNNPFQKFITLHRHFFTNIYISIQSYTHVIPTIRRVCNMIILFPTYDCKLAKFIFEEVSGFFPQGIDQFLNIVKYVRDKNGKDFLFIDVGNGKVYCNLNEEINIDKADDNNTVKKVRRKCYFK